MDVQPEVRDLAKRASRYCLDLGDTVHRDVENCVAGGSSFVYRGTLDAEGTAVAVKTFRFGHKSDPGVIKVSGVLGCSKAFVTVYCREVHTWSKLDHDNVLPVLGFTTNSTRQCLSYPHGWKGETHMIMCRT